MNTDVTEEKTGTPLASHERTQLLELHKTLLRLHKILLEAEREAYERVHGQLANRGALLSLVMYDPWFDWLHRISELVVRIDILTESDEAKSEEAQEILTAARTLFKASESGVEDTEFMRRYKAILQREPASVMAHAEVQKALIPHA